MSFFKFFLTLLSSFFLITLLLNQSIGKYLEQKYHINLEENPLLIAIAKPAHLLSSLTQTLLPDPTILSYHTQSIPSLQEESKTAISLKDGKLIIKDKVTFLLIGDSMMQGISLTLTPKLKEKKFQVIDIAKQSTGLTYLKFFNWEEVIQDTLKKNPHINVMLVMLGANDPWNIGKIKFGTPQWDDLYSQRIQKILDLAKEHHVFVFWYEVPMIKNQQLNEKIQHLNHLYEAQANRFNAIFLKTNALLSPDGRYQLEILNHEGKQIKVRANDGIHFTIKGSQILSNLLLDHIMIEETQNQDQIGKNL